ncbi:signal peptidase I [Kitasatospora azatica]|uniref:signal peptidase I n=1 Tax=Kitasatospora azatica TaxID=58347 RepID=UPI0009FE30F3|nr:signal peptidase I [Kitasatospora azatica]
MSSLAEETPGPAAARATPAATGPVPRRRLPGVLQAVALVLGLGMLVGGFALLAFDYAVSFVPTPSMKPTIAAGDTVLARRVDGGSIGRGDVVIFSDPLWGNETMVKRVIGVGGDTVTGDEQGRITVDGKPIDETYLAAGAPISPAFKATVPAGRLFVLGDNRNGSLDSRVHLDQLSGTIAATEVTARVEATVWPLSHLGLHGRTVAFDALTGPVAARPGPLVPLAWTTVAGAVVIVLTSLTGPVAGLARRLRGRR